MIRKSLSLSLFTFLAAIFAFTLAPAASHAQTVGTSNWFNTSATGSLSTAWEILSNAFNTNGTLDPSSYLYYEKANGDNFSGSVTWFSVTSSTVGGVTTLTGKIIASGYYSTANGLTGFFGTATETATQDSTGKKTIRVVTVSADKSVTLVTGLLVPVSGSGKILITQ